MAAPINNKHAPVPAVSYFTALDFANAFCRGRQCSPDVQHSSLFNRKLNFVNGPWFALCCDIALTERPARVRRAVSYSLSELR